MKFTWFHLMPYRFLPDDFKKKYHSVWVDIPRDLYDPEDRPSAVQRLPRLSSSSPTTWASTAWASTSIIRTPTA